MKLNVIKIGRPIDKSYQSLVDRFQKRLLTFYGASGTILKAQTGIEKSQKELFKKLEITAGKKKPSHKIIVLDERGKGYSSPQFADMLTQFIEESQVKQLSFVIGGPYGIPKELRASADVVWSLSAAVFPSDLAWVMAWEQIYRASTIIKGTAYHHE